MQTARGIVDVDEGKFKVRAQDDDVTFNIFDDFENSNSEKDCLQTDTTKEVFPKTKEQLDLSNVLYIIVSQRR